MSQSFLQTSQWAEFQRSLGREVFEYEKNGVFAKIIRHDIPLGKNYLYIPHGPEMDFNAMMGGFKSPIRGFAGYLFDLSRQEKSIFVKTEPLAGNVAQMLVEAGFRRARKEVQPSKTVIVNIQESDINLLGAMHHKTRYNIKVAENHGVTVDESKDMTTFWRLLQKTIARGEFSSHPKSYYEKLLNFDWGNNGPKVKLFLAKYKSKPAAAAAIVLIHNGIGYYLHGASDYEHRSAMAPFMLHWRIIQLLRKIGVESYDLWGIDAKKWPGVTRFKLNWGGRIIDRPGSFDLPISKVWYQLYKLGRKIF